MSGYVLQLKGKLGELRRKKLELITAANSHAEAVKDRLALASISSIEEIDADQVLYHAKEFHRLRAEYLGVLAEIKKIRRELGEE